MDQELKNQYPLTWGTWHHLHILVKAPLCCD